jgi:hypothetical protein
MARTDLVEQYAAQPATAALASDDDQRLWGMVGIAASQANSVTCTLPAPVDASRARALLASAIRSPGGASLSLVLRDDATPAHSVTLSGVSIATEGAWEVLRFDLPQGGTFNWNAVTAVRYESLVATATYHFGPVLLEADPALDLVVMGGDGTSAGAGRFYGDGMAAIKEAHGT